MSEKCGKKFLAKRFEYLSSFPMFSILNSQITARSRREPGIFRTETRGNPRNSRRCSSCSGSPAKDIRVKIREREKNKFQRFYDCNSLMFFINQLRSVGYNYERTNDNIPGHTRKAFTARGFARPDQTGGRTSRGGNAQGTRVQASQIGAGAPSTWPTSTSRLPRIWFR